MDTAPEAPTKIPVINRETRLRQIAYHLPAEQLVDAAAQPIVRPRETKIVYVRPGLNMVPLDDVRAAGLSASDVRGLLTIQRPTELPEYDAIHVAGMTVSKSALQSWLADESRPNVVAAIRERLSGKQKQAE